MRTNHLRLWVRKEVRLAVHKIKTEPPAPYTKAYLEGLWDVIERAEYVTGYSDPVMMYRFEVLRQEVRRLRLMKEQAKLTKGRLIDVDTRRPI